MYFNPNELVEPGIGLCSVCGDRADGYHYGVLSCRGCNAFFRRAVAFNLQFHCRREGHCEINKNARCACRYCRLQKCCDVGMDRSAVQIRREVKDLLGLTTNSAKNNSGPQSSYSADSSTISQPSITPFLSAKVFDSAKSLDSPQLKSRFLGSMSSSLANSPQVAHPLDRFVEWYFCQRYRRSSMLCSTVEQILLCSQQRGQQQKMATIDDLCQVNKVQMVLLFEWIEQLDEFETLAHSLDKIRLLRTFAPKYLLLDILIYTLEQGFTDYILLPNGSYIHRQSLYCGNQQSTYVNYENGGKELRKLKAAEMMFNDPFLSIIEELIQTMAEFGLTFGELISLRLLLFWDIYENSNVSPGNAQIIENASKRALNDLQSWYEIHSLDIRGDRMDNLLGFLPVIKKFSKNLSSITSLIPEFNTMYEWQFIADLLCPSSTINISCRNKKN
uniref:Nuclear receptor n=1 Tax=Meloidogyne incognita TaxID=6306 RepID=A0A914KTX0_MELIC